MFEQLKQMILNGIDLQYGKLTLCDLSHYRCGHYRPGRYKYQIYCDDQRVRDGKTNGCYRLYYENRLDDAIKKFLEIKEKIKAEVR